MYKTMADIADMKSVELAERASLVDIVARGFSRYLERLLREPAILGRPRNAAAGFLEHLNDGSIARGLLYSGMAIARWSRLMETVKSLRGGAEGSSLADAIAWGMPAPIPDSARIRSAGGVNRWVSASLKETHRKMTDDGFALQTALDRQSLLLGGNFTSDFVRRQNQRLEAFLRDLSSRLESQKSRIRRIVDFSIQRTMTADAGKRHKMFHIPTNKGLSLISEHGGFLIRAHFKSPIADQRVWAIVKESIERDWKGTFELGGVAYNFRTEIMIDPLAAGEKTGDEFLLLSESKTSASQADGKGIYLTHKFGYAVPAHEFGHVLGLEDDYVETYDFDAMQVTTSGPSDSLMANTVNNRPGVVLPRHLKLAYQLLRRRRLIRPLIQQ